MRRRAAGRRTRTCIGTAATTMRTTRRRRRRRSERLRSSRRRRSPLHCAFIVLCLYSPTDVFAAATSQRSPPQAHRLAAPTPSPSRRVLLPSMQWRPMRMPPRRRRRSATAHGKRAARRSARKRSARGWRGATSARGGTHRARARLCARGAAAALRPCAVRRGAESTRRTTRRSARARGSKIGAAGSLIVRAAKRPRASGGGECVFVLYSILFLF